MLHFSLNLFTLAFHRFLWFFFFYVFSLLWLFIICWHLLLHTHTLPFCVCNFDEFVTFIFSPKQRIRFECAPTSQNWAIQMFKDRIFVAASTSAALFVDLLAPNRLKCSEFRICGYCEKSQHEYWLFLKYEIKPEKSAEALRKWERKKWMSDLFTTKFITKNNFS